MIYKKKSTTACQSASNCVHREGGQSTNKLKAYIILPFSCGQAEDMDLVNHYFNITRIDFGHLKMARVINSLVHL